MLCCCAGVRRKRTLHKRARAISEKCFELPKSGEKVVKYVEAVKFEYRFIKNNSTEINGCILKASDYSLNNVEKRHI